MSDNRTTESLLARRALAEKATRGEWITTGINSVHGGYRNRLIYPNEDPHVLIASMNNTTNSKCAEDADHIAANSPDVVMADIDEILHLRARTARLRRFIGMLYKSMPEDDVDDMIEKLACPWCGGTGHISDCETADIRIKEKMERLEKEAQWLAERASIKDCVMDDTVENCVKKGFPCVACFREAARKAVEVPHEN